jgi:Domain of unknown function (DUF892)
MLYPFSGGHLIRLGDQVSEISVSAQETSKRPTGSISTSGAMRDQRTLDGHRGWPMPTALINGKGLTLDKATKPTPKAEPQMMDLSDLLEHALKDIYYAEKKIYKSLPKMIKAAQDPALKDGLTAHRDETAQQIEIL